MISFVTRADVDSANSHVYEGSCPGCSDNLEAAPRKGREPIMLPMYLTGCIVTTLGVLVACIRLRGMRDGRRLSAALLATVAGVLWPVLVIGVFQLVGVVLLVDAMRSRCSRRPEEQPIVAVARLEPVT